MFIKTLNNQTRILSINNLEKVIDIKKKICDIEGIPILNQQLFCGTKMLEDLKNLSDYNLSDMSNIDMKLSILGGGKGATHNRGRHDVNTGKRELVLSTPGETVYGIVTKICGNKRVLVIRIDNGSTIIGRISGSIHAWVKKDDIVLVGLRDFQEDKVDIIWRYSPEEARKLVRAGYIPQNSVVEKSADNDNISKVDFYDQNVANKEEDDIEPNTRRYEMPSSDDSSDNDEQEDFAKKNEDVLDDFAKKNADFAKKKDDFAKNNDEFDIDNI